MIIYIQNYSKVLPHIGLLKQRGKILAGASPLRPTTHLGGTQGYCQMSRCHHALLNCSRKAKEFKNKKYLPVIRILLSMVAPRSAVRGDGSSPEKTQVWPGRSNKISYCLTFRVFCCIFGVPCHRSSLLLIFRPWSRR